MEFGKYLGKGLWGLADKALPVVYGLGYVLLVIRVLPEEEFGNFVLVQEIFLIISGLGTAYALQPLLKYAAEDAPDIRNVTSAGFLLHLAFTVVCALLVAALAGPVGALLNSPGLSLLLVYVPAMLAASILRNVSLIVLQARFRIQEVFWTDAAHFIGAPLLTWVVSRMHLFNSARALVLINIVSLSVSSLVGLACARSLLRITLAPGAAALRKVAGYGKFTLGGIMSYLVYSKADSFILAAFTGPAQVAVYNSAKVFVRVYEMLAQVVQMFVLPAVSRLSWQGDFRSLQALVEKSILFFTLSMLPVFVVFLAFPRLLVDLLYGGRYTEAVELLRVFSLLAFVVPLMSVGSNLLLGLGQARQNFILGMQMLGVSGVAYLIAIPMAGSLGAVTAYVLATYVITWATALRMDTFVHVTPGRILQRHTDIVEFVRSRLR